MKNLIIFGIPASGKTVFLTMLFAELRQRRDYILEPIPGGSLDYFMDLLKTLESGEWPAPTTATDEIKKLEFRVKIKSMDKWLKIITHDISGEDIKNYFNDTLNPERKDKLKNFFDSRLDDSGLFMFLLDPDPEKNKIYLQEQLFFNILFALRKKKSGVVSKVLKKYEIKMPLIFVLTKDDFFKVEEPRKELLNKFPLAVQYAESLIKKNNRFYQKSSSTGGSIFLREERIGGTNVKITKPQTPLRPEGVIECFEWFLQFI